MTGAAAWAGTAAWVLPTALSLVLVRRNRRLALRDHRIATRRATR